MVSQLLLVQSTINTLLVQKKNNGFNNICDWYESKSHDTTSLFTLFEVQKHIEDNDNNEQVHSIRHLSRKLSERYGAERSKVRLRQRKGLSKVCLCKRGPIT